MTIIRNAFWIAFILVLLFPGVAYAKGPEEGIVVGGTFTLASGETYATDLVAIGGEITLEEGSVVSGNVILIGGSLKAAGKVTGDVASIGGSIRMAGTTEVGGDVACIGITPEIEEGARITGSVQSVANFVIPIPIPITINPAGGPAPQTPGGISIVMDVNPLYEITAFLFRTLLLSAIAVLVVMVLPAQSERVSKVLVRQPALSFLAGILTLIAAAALLLILVLTICLSLLGLLGGLVLAAAILFGWISLGLEIGKNLSVILKTPLHPAAAAGMGTMLLTLIAGGIWYIPCAGAMLVTLTASFGLGAVLLTRFGGRDYQSARANPSSEILPTK